MMPSTPMSVRQAPSAAPEMMSASAAVGLDSSSPEAFIRSVAPYAARVSKATGIPAEALIGMAANETGYGKYAPGNNLFGIKGTGPAGTFSTPTWEDYGNGPVTITDNFRAYHAPSESFLDFASLILTSPRYKGAVGQTTVEGFVNGLRQGGYMTDPDYVSKISAITTRYQSVIQDSLRSSGTTAPSTGRGILVGAPAAQASAPVASTAGRPGAGVVVPDQFNIGLPAQEAYAACGPVAAVAFAQVYGRNPSPAEAMQLAKQTGWTAEGGMNGIGNEKRLLDKMGLQSTLDLGANWDHIRADALQRQPVILSTPGHYFVIDGFDAKTGAYHVGQSGKAFRGGSDWLTPAQIEGLGGTPSGALFTVHPLAGQQMAGQQVAGQQVAGQPRQVLPPQAEVLASANQRQVLPPLDLANTPMPPVPPPAPAASPPPPAPTPVAPPPPIAPVAPPPPPVGVPPPPVAPPPPPVADPPTVVAAAPAESAPVAYGPAGPPPPPPYAPPAQPVAPPPPAPVAPAPPAPVAFGPAPPPPYAPPPAPVGPAQAARAAPAEVVQDPPTLVAASAEADPPTIVAAPSNQQDTSRPAIPPGGLAVGAIAAGTPRQPPPPPPPRRRPEDDEA